MPADLPVKPDEVFFRSTNHSTGTSPEDQEGSPTCDDDEVNTPTIKSTSYGSALTVFPSDLESLKKGIIKRSKNKEKEPFTILLIGETGVGKSSILELIANVLIGNDSDHYNFEFLGHSNEQDGPDNQSQTNSACFYELTSKNGIVVRVLDTPGLADTRGIQQDELHKESIATQIKNHIGSVTAVLVLANGTVPRITVGTDYALSTLSTIFPKTLASNIGFVFTNVSSPLHWNFSGDSIPDALKDAPQFLLNNPIALQRKYLKLKDNLSMMAGRTGWRSAVEEAEQSALEMLAELFDWLDGLEPQPTTEIVEEPHNIRVKTTNPLAPVDQVANKKAKNFSMFSWLARVLPSLRIRRQGDAARVQSHSGTGPQ